jgi:hypothetical protein
MAEQFAEEARRAEDLYLINLYISRQHYLDMLVMWRHCRQITPLKPAALRLEKLARSIREELDRLGAPPAAPLDGGGGDGHDRHPPHRRR